MTRRSDKIGHDPPGAGDTGPPEMAPGEFAHLLDEIKKEPVPLPLLGLARRLESALRRRRGDGSGGG